MLTRVIFVLALLLLLVPLAPIASATPVMFTTPQFGAGNGLATFSTTAANANFTFVANIGHLTQTPEDGYGIWSCLGYEIDEIEGLERLTILLSTIIGGGPVWVESVTVADLFYEDGYREGGYLEIDGSGDWLHFLAPLTNVPGQTNGELVIPIGQYVTSLVFRAPGLGLEHWQITDKEYAVMGMDISAPTGVPEPGGAALAIIGTSLLGLGIRYRRRVT